MKRSGSDFAVLDFQSARAGEREARGRLLQNFRAYLLTVANAEIDSELKVKGGASDLVQESLLEANKDFSRFEGTTQEEFVHWLKRILKNNLVDLVRRYRHASSRDLGQELPLDRESASELRQQLPAATRPPIQDLVAIEKRIALDAGLAQLPEAFREVIELRHTQGLTFPEIAEALGKSTEAVQKMWYRALRRLRENLNGRSEFQSSI